MKKFDHNNWALYSQSRLKFPISNRKLTLKGIVLNNVTEVVTEFSSSNLKDLKVKSKTKLKLHLLRNLNKMLILCNRKKEKKRQRTVLHRASGIQM